MQGMRSSIFLVVFLLGLLDFAYAQIDACALISKTDQRIKKNHIDPVDFNLTSYHQVLNLYIESIDPEFIIFSNEDSLYLHKQLEQPVTLCNVFKLTQNYIIRRLKTHDSLVRALVLSYCIDNSMQERFVIPCFKEVSRKSTNKAVQLYAKQYYKYLFIKKNYVLKEAEITLEPKRILDVIIKRRSAYYTNLFTSKIALLELYLSAVSLRYDPHTLFLNADEHQQWNTALAKEEYSFGFDFEITENESYKVTQIIPGSAAWNSKQLDEGDCIDQIELLNGKKYLIGIDTDQEIYEAFVSKQNAYFLLDKIRWNEECDKAHEV